MIVTAKTLHHSFTVSISATVVCHTAGTYALLVGHKKGKEKTHHNTTDCLAFAAPNGCSILVRESIIPQERRL